MRTIGFLLIFMLLAGSLRAQTKQKYVIKSPQFGCTFEDGFFEAKIIAKQADKVQQFQTPVYIEGCQVLSIPTEKVPKAWWALFPPTDIDDAGNTLIKAERGIEYEVHLILP